jgi:hypothetical protein
VVIRRSSAICAFYVLGASSAAAIGSKTAIYSVKIGSALSRLAGILKSSAKKLWEMAKVVKSISKFTFGAFKKFTVGKYTVVQHNPYNFRRFSVS